SSGVDGIGIVAGGTEIRNVILDHCSISWATGVNLTISGRNGGVRDVTIQDCIIAEGLNSSSGGVVLNGWNNYAYGPDRISLLRNLITNNQTRGPNIGS